MRRTILSLAVVLTPTLAHAATLTVGPSGTYATPCAAFAKAADGDTIEIDAKGPYKGDVCAIARSSLLIRGVGCRRQRP